MSISKAQADALAESFLDDIGSDKDSFQPKETVSVLLQLAGELIDNAQENLNASNTNASGKLSESIEAEEPTTGNGFIQQDISMNFYGQFVNKGVRGTKGGRGQYAFKNEAVGSKMLKSFQSYIKEARSKIGTEPKGMGRNESKNAAVAERQNAYAMARSVKQKGIKPTYFMDKAINDIDKDIEERFGEALRIDVINSLPNEL